LQVLSEIFCLQKVQSGEMIVVPNKLKHTQAVLP
jgi:hypothetical protein